MKWFVNIIVGLLCSVAVVVFVCAIWQGRLDLKQTYTIQTSGVVTFYDGVDVVEVSGKVYPLKSNRLLETDITVREGDVVSVYSWKDYNFVADPQSDYGDMLYDRSSIIMRLVLAWIGLAFIVSVTALYLYCKLSQKRV